jgi:hypothetical protein
MRKLLVGVAVLCLLVPALAQAADNIWATGTVVSVGLKARSITFTYTMKGEATKKTTAKWDQKTKWIDETAGQDKSKPATVDLARSLKKGSRIYVKITEGVFEEVTAKAPERKD